MKRGAGRVNAARATPATARADAQPPPADEADTRRDRPDGDFLKRLDMHATAEALRGFTGREVGAAKLLVTLDHIEGRVTPKWVRDIADATPIRPAARPETVA